MTDLTLYWLVPKDRSNRVRWLLTELGVDFSERQLSASSGEHRAGEYLDLNPFGKVPTIVEGDLTLSESGAILLYLLERYDTAGNLSPRRDTELWPAFLQWFFWSLTTLESAVFGFTNDPVEATRAHLERFLAPLDQLLASADYLVGNSFTAADVVCVYDLGLLYGAYDLETYPSLFSYLTRTLKRPAAARFAAAIVWPATRDA